MSSIQELLETARGFCKGERRRAAGDGDIGLAERWRTIGVLIAHVELELGELNSDYY